MRVISFKKIQEAMEKYPEKSKALDGWFRVMKTKKNHFENFSELKSAFNSVDKVDNYYVFDVGGNALRIITFIHFKTKTVFIKHILNHKEYDKGNWKKGDRYEK